MAVEIERKFLATQIPWRSSTRWVDITQGYLSMDPKSTTRVRFETAMRDGRQVERGVLTIKGVTKGISRDEFEYEIPARDAALMISGMCSLLINKRRWFIPYGDHEWHVDEFRGNNQGLVIAEIELSDENEPWLSPDWIGTEVTHDPRYINANLAVNPYQFW